MGSRVGLRVILHRERGALTQCKAFNGVIVQVNMGQLQMRCLLGLFQIHREAVILGGYLRAVSAEVLNRMIGATMPVMHFEGFKTGCPGQELMTQTNAHQWDFAFQQSSDDSDLHVHGCRITGTIGQRWPMPEAPEARSPCRLNVEACCV